jgi:hypothetical protein
MDSEISLRAGQMQLDLPSAQAMAAEHSGYAGPFCCYITKRGIIESTPFSNRGIRAILVSEIGMMCIQL